MRIANTFYSKASDSLYLQPSNIVLNKIILMPHITSNERLYLDGKF